jgi:RNA binding exosome subunit
MDIYFSHLRVAWAMVQTCPFISAHLRALALATEVEDRVLAAMRLASASEDVSVTRAEGHFGTPIAVLEVRLDKSRDIRRLMGRLEEFGLRAALAGQAEARVDDERVFHFRLDKQKAFLGELSPATGKDVIDVAMKVGVYPASREAAVRAVEEWLGGKGSKVL